MERTSARHGAAGTLEPGQPGVDILSFSALISMKRDQLSNHSFSSQSLLSGEVCDFSTFYHGVRLPRARHLRGGTTKPQ